MTTREEIKLELQSYIGKNKEEKKALMIEFLTDIGETPEVIEKIVSDLESYDEY